ncbi:hypothetical protein ACH5RR_006539 [Cinchona calisaya]|uniref:GTD-binding domain-containing protein n=1 Tax=Cinchona calisaya TaxID=153742 RepID=A0ABD3AP97_9GENT
MEAEHYKRLSEEKTSYAEESQAIFKKIIFENGMEVAALDYQVQAYRYKLPSMGCADSGIGDLKYPECLLLRNASLVGDMNLHSIGRRNSASFISVRSGLKNAVTERKSSLSPDTGLVQKTVEDCRDQDTNDSDSDWEKKTDSSTVGDINTYWEQIRKLDFRVKEIEGVSYATRFCS